MHLPVALQLIATFLQFLAGFVLSVEAIGLQRVRSFIARLVFIGSALTRRDVSRHRSPREVFLDPARILAGVAAMVGVAFGYYVDTHAPTWARFVSGPLLRQLAPFAGGLFGVVFATVIVCAVFGLLSAMQAFDSRVRSGTSGIIGFVLLTMGYLIQFVTTCVQATSQ